MNLARSRLNIRHPPDEPDGRKKRKSPWHRSTPNRSRATRSPRLHRSIARSCSWPLSARAPRNSADWSSDRRPAAHPRKAGLRAGTERTEMKQAFRKNRRDGMVFGVCAGMADHFGIAVLCTRVAFVALNLPGFGLPPLPSLAIAILELGTAP